MAIIKPSHSSAPKYVSVHNKTIVKPQLQSSSSPCLLQQKQTENKRPSNTIVKRSVSFETNVKIIPVERIYDDVAIKKNDLFYCRSDYRRFKKESKRISNLLDNRLRMGSSRSGDNSNKKNTTGGSFLTFTCKANCQLHNNHNNKSISGLLGRQQPSRTLTLSSFSLW